MNNLHCWVSWMLTSGANIPLPLMPTIPTVFQRGLCAPRGQGNQSRAKCFEHSIYALCLFRTLNSLASIPRTKLRKSNPINIF